MVVIDIDIDIDISKLKKRRGRGGRIIVKEYRVKEEWWNKLIYFIIYKWKWIRQNVAQSALIAVALTMLGEWYWQKDPQAYSRAISTMHRFLSCSMPLARGACVLHIPYEVIIIIRRCTFNAGFFLHIIPSFSWTAFPIPPIPPTVLTIAAYSFSRTVFRKS